MLQAVCVEAGMLALRRDAIEVNHEDFNEGIVAVQVCIMILVTSCGFFFSAIEPWYQTRVRCLGWERRVAK